MASVDKELFVVPPTEPEAKKTKKPKKEMSAEAKAVLLERLAKGRETAAANRAAKKKAPAAPAPAPASAPAAPAPASAPAAPAPEPTPNVVDEVRALRADIAEMKREKDARRKKKDKEARVRSPLVPKTAPEPAKPEPAPPPPPAPAPAKPEPPKFVMEDYFDCNTGKVRQRRVKAK